MSPDAAVFIVRKGLELMLMLSLPALLAGLIVGLIISIFQAATQIQEMTLTFIPKLLAVFGVLIVLFPWMIKLMYGFTTQLFANISLYLQ